jgi:DNA (cytosine-5)-methyltransferase 1
VSAYADRLQAAWRAHLAPRDPHAPTVISTFAGCGGSSLGYSIAGYRELLAVEFNAHAAATLRRNFHGLDVFEGDIATLTVKEIQKRTGLARGDLGVLDGSPPCQGFSLVGQRNFSDPRNQLFTEYVRLLKGLQPRAFVMENVPGLVVGKMRLIFVDMLRALKGAGYVVTAKVLNAKYFDVPQDRRRIVFLGLRADLARDDFDHLARQTVPLSIQAAVAGLPAAATWTPLAVINRRIWKHARIGQHGGQLGLMWEKAKTTSHFTHVKLNPYRPAPTLTKEGGRNFLHWSEPRILTIAEAKRLASFPDEFTFEPASFGEEWGRIGNSVPPFLMAAVARHLRPFVGNPMKVGRPHERGKRRAA